MFQTVPLSNIWSFSLYTQQCHSGLLTAVCKPLWHIPLLCVQWKTPDVGQRNCLKHVMFYSKNKFQKLAHIVGFIIRTNFIQLLHTTRHILSTFTNQCHCLHLHSLCPHLPHYLSYHSHSLHCHSTTYHHQSHPLHWIHSTSYSSSQSLLVRGTAMLLWPILTK